MADREDVPGSLQAALAGSPSIPAGLLQASYPTGVIDMQTAVARHIADTVPDCDPLPLETLHCRLSPEQRRTNEHSLNALSVRLASAPGELLAAYHRLVRHVARGILRRDVLFEANPFLRFYFPGPTLDGYRSPDGAAVSYHSDTLFGDAFEQINCWLPLASARGTNTLQCASFDDSIGLLASFAEQVNFDAGRFAMGRDLFFQRLCVDAAWRAEVSAACSPVNLDYGQILLFDSRLIHGTLDNREDRTRVSIDFRLLPVSAYWASRCHNSNMPRGVARRLRGHYWDSRRAFEL